MTVVPRTVDALRTAWGSPKRWTSPGAFGILLSSMSEVETRTHTPRTDEWERFGNLRQAHAYGERVRRAQPGLEFEVMRLEHGTWRDFLGRTVHEVVAARWSTP